MRKRKNLLDNSNERFEQELDLISLLKKVRSSNDMWDNFLTKH